MKPKLLLIDDDSEIRTQMKWALNQEYDVVLAEDHLTALAAFKEHKPAVVLLDLGLPPNPNGPEEGFAIMSEILHLNSLTKIIIVSGQGEKSNALQAIGAGAYDFAAKPVDKPAAEQPKRAAAESGHPKHPAHPFGHSRMVGRELE